jgi:UDP-2-acetamido-3-amino-2,3-dideoxy-glucuronate N-acetyltransferase
LLLVERKLGINWERKHFATGCLGIRKVTAAVAQVCKCWLKVEWARIIDFRRRILVRNFHALGVLRYVCDSRSEALQEAREQFGVDTCSSLKELINDPEIRGGVAIAAPAAQHYRLAKEFLLAGKDVYVEKPLSLRVDEGQELVEIAEARQRVLMVGHILQYHPAILKLKELIGSGELGRI